MMKFDYVIILREEKGGEVEKMNKTVEKIMQATEGKKVAVVCIGSLSLNSVESVFRSAMMMYGQTVGLIEVQKEEMKHRTMEEVLKELVPPKIEPLALQEMIDCKVMEEYKPTSEERRWKKQEYQNRQRYYKGKL